VLQNYNVELEQKVRERTQTLEEANEKLDMANHEIHKQLDVLSEQAREIEIINSALLESNAYLDERAEIISHQNNQLNLLNKEKDVFLGIVAHDLKNPLSSIILSADMITHYAQGIVAEKIVTMGERIMVTGTRMRRIIEDLLDFSALQSGTITLHREVLFPNDVFADLYDVYQEGAKAKDIRLHWFMEDGVMVYADKQRLLQILENLLSNALKYSPPQRNIWLRIYNGDGLVYITIQDQGQGITSEDREKLFGRFARLSAQPTGGEHSSGLGLSIVKQMVEAMGGNVWAESEGKDQGAIFIVTLPAQVQP
jgi:signal transduction histidine kinase